MASGEKLPKTNLNLIQDIDMIDHADINAIAQAVESNRTRTNLFYPVRHVVPGTDLHTLDIGFYSVGGSGEYVNGIGVQMYGTLTVFSSSVVSYRHLIFHSAHNRIYAKAFSGTTWSDWKEIFFGREVTQEWTPSLEGTETKGVAEYSSRQGVWSRIGNTVFIQGRLTITSYTGGEGYFVIRGLPDYFRVKYYTPITTVHTMDGLGVDHVAMVSNDLYLRGPAGGAIAPQNFTTSRTIFINGAIQLDVG